MATWSNADGLLVRFGTDRAEAEFQDGGQTEDIRSLVVKVDSQNIQVVGDVNGDRPSIPANAVIVDALLVATAAWVGTGTLTLGLADSTGTAIDADGIDAAVDVDVALAAAGDVVACDGALVDKTATIGTAAGWVYGAIGGTVSAGTANLHLRYFVPQV